MICSMRMGSASRTSGCSGTETVNECSRASMKERVASSALATRRRDIDGLLAKLDRSSRDARDFEQVVEQSRQKTHLAIDGLSRLVDHRVPGIGATDDLHGDLDRRERVAQLVREHGEKLVLGLVRRGEVQERLPMLVRSEASLSRVSTSACNSSP